MSRFVHLLRTPDARYAIGAVVSWPIYGVLCTVMLKMFDKHYGVPAGVSWMVSYWVVYVIQKYGTFGAMSREARLREIGYYAVGVVGLSTAVNLGLVTLLADYDLILNKTAAVAAAAVAAAFVAWFVSTRILRIGIDEQVPPIAAILAVHDAGQNSRNWESWKPKIISTRTAA
jgi:putative flippase GtrA